jgi:DNA-binding response OmpR family regulator
VSRNGAARILVVEDEAHLAEGLLFNLRAEGYDVELARDGESALARLLTVPEAEAAGSFKSGRERGVLGLEQPVGQRPAPATSLRESASALPEADAPLPVPAGALQEFDAVLLDVMLPGKSGFDVVGELRAAGMYVPVLMLTARGRPEDVLRGLEAGADDYLPKPFDLGILLARIHVLLRRMRWQRAAQGPAAGEAGEQELASSYSFAGRTIDFSMLELRAKGTITRLTLMEADFLRYLSLNPFRIIPRTELLEQVWRVREDTDTRAIDNFVVRLRRYLEDEPANPVYLKTVRGVGYRFLPHGE